MLFGWKCQTNPGLVIWTGLRSEIPNGCELRAPHGGFLSQILDGPKLGNMVCFFIGKLSNGPRLGGLDGPLVRKFQRECSRGTQWSLCVNFLVRPRLSDVVGCLVGSPNGSEMGYGLRQLIKLFSDWTPDRLSCRKFGWKLRW